MQAALTPRGIHLPLSLFPFLWRKLLWSKVEGTEILEVGVGTGKNFPYYPVGAEVVAVDFSGKMLERAKERVNKQGV